MPFSKKKTITTIIIDHLYLSRQWSPSEICGTHLLTLIYPAHFEDVPCQSGVNHIFEGKNDYVSS